MVFQRLFAGLTNVLSALPFFVLVLIFFMGRAEFQVTILTLNRVLVVNVLGRGFPAMYSIQCCCFGCSISFATEIGRVLPTVNIFFTDNEDKCPPTCQP